MQRLYLRFIEQHMVFLWGGLLLAAVGAFAQPAASNAPFPRFQGLRQCNFQIKGRNDIFFTEKLFFESKFAKQFSSQRSQYEQLSLLQRAQVIDNVETYLMSSGRLNKPLSKLGHHKLGYEIEKSKFKPVQGSESVNAGGDVRGGGFAGNRRIFVSQNSQGADCWTYAEQAGSKQVFDYDGFEEVAAINASQVGACSAVIVGQNHALTARHCAAAGLLLIPTKKSRVSQDTSAQATTARKAQNCSLSNNYSADCEFELVEYTDVKKFESRSTSKLEFDFLSPIDGSKGYFEILGGNNYGTPDMRMLEFTRSSDSKAKQALLVTARLAAYNKTLVKIDDYFPFVRAGYGYSFESSKPALTIGSWRSVLAPVQASRVLVLDTEEQYAYVALFHPKLQESRICEGDSGGALFFGTPNGKEPNDQGRGSRELVGIISAAKSAKSSTACLKSPVEVTQIINSRYLEILCNAADSKLNGCETQ